MRSAARRISNKYQEGSTMQGTPDSKLRKEALRQRAEAWLRKSPQEISHMPTEDVQQLVHELQVHQIELEMQNAELQRTSRQLEVARDRYTHLYLHAPVGYVTLDAAGNIREANLAATSLLGVDRSDLLGTRLARFVIWEDQGEFLFHCQQALAVATTLVTEISLRQQDGSLRHVRVESVAVQDEAEGEKHCRMALVDITKRVRAEEALMRAHVELEQRVQERTEALRRAERLALLGQLTGGVAHELRNPLHTILLHVEELETELQQMPPAHRRQIEASLTAIRLESARLNDVVQNYLSLARLGNLQRQPVALGALLEEIVAEFRARLQPRNIALRLEGVSDLGQVSLSSSTFRRAILNLLQNAMHAMESTPEGGRLLLRGQQTPTQVVLEISDTGNGIPTDQIPYIFDPLQTTKPGGTGLGLHVVREIVVAHDGRITVQSEVGRGTTFTMTLPLATAQENSSA